MPKYVTEFGKDGGPVEPDGRLDAPAFHRNHTGQHVVHFAGHSPDITWWPSDLNAQHLRSIVAWRAHAGLPNIRPPLRIDLSDPAWARTMADDGGPRELLALFCANVIHIAPWGVAEGLFAGAGGLLQSDGRFFLYGPFKRDGKHTAVSNAVFDASLRDANPEWGVRDIADLERLGVSTGLALLDIRDMPSNNLILVFGRPASVPVLTFV